jgi:hypothetical protein
MAERNRLASQGLMAVIILAVGATLAAEAWPTPGEDAADAAMSTIRPEAIRAGMRFLADDALEGRGTGTRGYEIAAKYMASQFEAIGLQPAGENGTYFQNVPFRQGYVDEANTSLTLVRNGKEERLTFRENYITASDPVRPVTEVEAPVVFVGSGVTAPESGYDDYEGIDAKGKIVALLFSAPNFETTLKAHYIHGSEIGECRRAWSGRNDPVVRSGVRQNLSVR